MVCFTFNKILFGKAYNFFQKALSFNSLIKESELSSSINFLTLSISSLNFFRYVCVDLSSSWVTLKVAKTYKKVWLQIIISYTYWPLEGFREDLTYDIVILDDQFQATLYVLDMFF